ncbi:MAG TPA: molybdenum cofactor guanylyltransferase [Candidatus Binataceae bacterium]|nr:molybdenum cofactor guanylyltransferase [Candidatus Binataceae bacterium]
MTISASAIILAGGKSSRMGLPKATLPFGRATIIERLIAELGGAFAQVIVVAAPAADELFSIDHLLAAWPHAELVRDAVAYAGPAVALGRGLAHARGEIAFACSCDLPLLNAGVARALCAMIGSHDAVMPEVDGRLQPLHAVYRRAPCSAALAAMTAGDERRLGAIADRIDVRRVTAIEMRRLDPDLLSLLNVNTAEDYARALRLLRMSPAPR